MNVLKLILYAEHEKIIRCPFCRKNIDNFVNINSEIDIKTNKCLVKCIYCNINMLKYNHKNHVEKYKKEEINIKNEDYINNLLYLKKSTKKYKELKNKYNIILEEKKILEIENESLILKNNELIRDFNMFSDNFRLKYT